MSQAAGGSAVGMEQQATGKQSKPPEELQDNDTNSLEPGEVVTPPHYHASSPAVKKHLSKDLIMSKTLLKLPASILEQARKENGSGGTPNAQAEDVDDSEGLYSDSDSSGEDLKNVEDVQKARKEKQEEAAAATLPQAPPTPFLGNIPLRFHMRAPCFDFPRMGFMPRMNRGGPRGMRTTFFGRPPAPNRMGAPMMGGPPTQGPPPGAYAPQNPPATGNNSNSGCCKRLQSDVIWTALQPPVSFVFNLVSECSNKKHENCRTKAETADHNSKEAKLSSETKSTELLIEINRSREKSQHKNDVRGKPNNRSHDRNQNRGRTRERSKESHGKSTENSKNKDESRGTGRRKSRERSQDKNSNRAKSMNLSKEKDEIGGELKNAASGKSQERDQSRGKTKERSRERDRTRNKTREKSQARDQTKRKANDAEHTRVKSRKRSSSRDKRREKSKEKNGDLSKEKLKEKSTERSERKNESKIKNKDTNEEKLRERSKEKDRNHSKERLHERTQNKSEERKPEAKKVRNARENSKEGTDHKKDKLLGPLGDKTDERLKDKQRKRSREKSVTKCPKESGKDKLKEHSRETTKDRHQEKCKDPPNENGLDRSQRSSTPHDSFSESAITSEHASIRKNQTPPPWGSREGTPSMTPPQVQIPQTPIVDHANPKDFDIFADSPPRVNTAVSAPAATIERSTTPPLKSSIPIVPIAKADKLAPLLKASEIHSRIGALLEESDLHLDNLLATKEQLFRRTNEYKERKEAPKEIKAEYLPNSRHNRSASGRAEVEHHKSQPRHINPFKRESVLSGRKSSSRPSSKERRFQRHDSDVEDWDRDLELERNQLHVSQQTGFQPRKSDEYTKFSIKKEKDLTPPPLQTNFTRTTIKIERNATPPRHDVLVRNGAVATNAPPPAKEQESPDTDDYIDNWENDDSLASMPKNAPPVTPTPAPNANASLNATPLPPVASQFNGDDDDDDSNALWNAKSTPPPRRKNENLPEGNIHELYDKFMNSIKMSNEHLESETLDTSKNSSLSNSPAEESSSGSETSSTSSSSSETEEDSSSEDDDANESSSNDESVTASGNCNTNQDETAGKEQLQKKNNVSKDLRKLKSLEDNLARIQMMRENYDAGDEISEELLKMESLFLMQRNAIMDKYRKQELKSNSSEDQQPVDEQGTVQAQEVVKETSFPVNSIFSANREAIKLTISPLKLTRKSVIFDKDEADLPETSKAEPPKPPMQKPPKEIAIVKPTIVESRSKPKLRSPPPSAGSRRRSRSRSISRSRTRRRGSRTKSRTPSPRRRRLPSPRRVSRYAKRIGAAAVGGTRKGRSHSRSLTRSRTRSRSPSRRRRLPLAGHRKRCSISPMPQKLVGPRSPPPSRRRHSLSRDREREHLSRSRSPLPFKPPSPPMRRSWSKAPTRRRSFSRSRSRSISPRSRLSAEEAFNYFEENQGMEAAAYYYNMSLMQQEDQNALGEGYDAYAAYMDSAYNMEQAYAQYSEEYSNTYMDYMVEVASSPQAPGSVLRELPMAPMMPVESFVPIAPVEAMPSMAATASVMPVAVQKGNVLEIVPSGEDILEAEKNIVADAVDEPVEDTSKPKGKGVNFVDKVLPAYESDNEDRAVVEMAVERALRKYHEGRSQAAAKLQLIRDELLVLPPPPPPPLTTKPANLEKPVLVQKKPKYRYFHFDPFKCAIVKTYTRTLRSAYRPPFDPKHFAMLMKTGRLPQIPPGFLRHRPPFIPAHVDAVTRGAMLKEFFSKHPPPPLAMPMPVPNGMPYYLSGPPPTPSGAAVSPVPINVLPQPIPVLDGSGYQGYPQQPTMVPSPVPVPVPVPLPVPLPVSTDTTPPPALETPYFTPPPLPELPTLPELPSQFNVSSVPTITEIMPVDILEKLGPLPKTLDVDDGGGTASPVEISDDLKEVEAEPAEQPVVDVKPHLLVETQ
ncbi:serine/arginine repetitive matrix protein 2 isoform X1 [Drosophila mauritiana]|uniref:Serine/arginine repetitive matrix protein 2 isoform X1 n=1 Tax=Drosophila mauritiana TaxID=7226 RepID=A0A6P8JX63_DROMA|nr:serine/arginine repetitive matrix protein 2 isoform X1 [Drosophila mauritiana]